MRTLRFVLLILMLSFISFSFIFSAAIHYSGKVVSSSKRLEGPFNGWSILVKADGKQIASCPLDSTNHYKLFFADQGQKQFEFYVADLADTLLMQTVQPAFEENVLDFALPKSYSKEKGKAVCPVCHQAGETEEILYGDGLPGGCLVSFLSPHWFCKKDKVKF